MLRPEELARTVDAALSGEPGGLTALATALCGHGESRPRNVRCLVAMTPPADRARFAEALRSIVLAPAADDVRVRVDERDRWIEVRRGATTLLGNLGAAPTIRPTPAGDLTVAHPHAPRLDHDGDDVVLEPDGFAIWVDPH